MYAQGNSAPQGQQTPIPPFQYHPSALPPPPPFQQVSSAPPSSITQQGNPPIPPHIGMPGPPAYHPTNPVQQGRPLQAPPGGMLNAGHSYLPPPPPSLPVHGNTSVVNPYSNRPQNTQWAPNVRHMVMPPPLGQPSMYPGRPEMYTVLQPPKLAPPLPQQGQSLYRAPAHLPQFTGVQGNQHMPLPPPPPPLPPPPSISSVSNPSMFGSFGHTAYQDSHMAATGPLPPPPLPSSPPPPPPSPPPAAPPPPPEHFSITKNMSYHSESHSSSIHTVFDVMSSKSVDEVLAPNNIQDDEPDCDKSRHLQARTSFLAGSLAEDDMSSDISIKMDHPPPPPKPAEEKIVRKIEVICQFIAKNGPGFEDMAREKEFGNPEFEFLFGGEPGSEAAISHEYFLWMKKKCSETSKLQGKHGQNESVSKPSNIDSSPRLDSLLNTGASQSPSDSDMEMEDDITQPDEQRVYNSLEGPHQEDLLSPHHIEKKDHLNHLQNASQCLPEKGAVSPSLTEHIKGSGFQQLYPKEEERADMNLAGAARFSLKGDFENTTTLPKEDLGKTTAPAAAIAAGTSSEKFNSDIVEDVSPFRLLQDYASDDSSENDVEPHLENISPTRASPPVSEGDASLHTDSVSNLQTNNGLNILSSPGTYGKSFSDPTEARSPSMPSKDQDFPLKSEKTDKEIEITSIATEKAEELVVNNYMNQQPAEDAALNEAFQQEDALLEDGNVDGDSKSGTLKKEDVKDTSNSVKVDEFGRLVREGASDSDSGDSSSYKGKCVNRGRSRRRSRSRSRSRSPHDRRRSPRRRKEKRSRSRSQTPNKRRSRSRSPTFRRGGEFGVDKTRRGKGQIPECFEFLRGKCYRGASCRYLHHGFEKSDELRHHRSKQPSSRSSDFLEETENVGFQDLVSQQNEIKSQEMELLRDPGTVGSIMDGDSVPDFARGSMQSITSDQDGKLLGTIVAQSESSEHLRDTQQETQNVKEQFVDSTIHIHGHEICKDGFETSQMIDVNPACDAPKPSDTSHSIHASVDSLPHSGFPTSTTFQNQFNEPQHVISSVQSYPVTSYMDHPFPKDGPPPILPDLEFPSHPSQFATTLSQGTTTTLSPRLPRDYSAMLPAAEFPSRAASTENRSPYEVPFPDQHSHFSVPPNSSWISLPPPPPRPPYVMQHQYNQLPPRKDFSPQTFPRPYQTDLPAFNRVGDFQHQVQPQTSEPHWPPFQMGDFRRNTPPMCTSMSQPFRGQGHAGEDSYGSRLPLHSQPELFSRESETRRTHSSESSLVSGELYNSSYRNHHYLQQLQPPHSRLQGPSHDSVLLHSDEPVNFNSTMSRYKHDLDRSQPSHLSEFGGSRNINNFNPYASTFDQPLGSTFSSNVSRQVKDTPPYGTKYDVPFSLSHGSTHEHAMKYDVPSSPNSSRAVGHNVPRPGGDPYDPLFDSIEPSSNPSRKYERGEKCDVRNDSGTMLRLSGSHTPLDVEENSKQKVIGSAAVTSSEENENDEYGETADAEVGAVENGSPSDPLDIDNTAAGDIEIDQVKTPGKSKKNKDSRSSKVFKVALANFVKEVLKPSWRQGNMSKEAFKTIVKKTVDKVSGAMKKHQIPKSQTKINQYIDSSQRKLTKLVMGYVDKYVKM